MLCVVEYYSSEVFKLLAEWGFNIRGKESSDALKYLLAKVVKNAEHHFYVPILLYHVLNNITNHKLTNTCQISRIRLNL